MQIKPNNQGIKHSHNKPSPDRMNMARVRSIKFTPVGLCLLKTKTCWWPTILKHTSLSAKTSSELWVFCTRSDSMGAGHSSLWPVTSLSHKTRSNWVRYAPLRTFRSEPWRRFSENEFVMVKTTSHKYLKLQLFGKGDESKDIWGEL